MAYSKNLFNRVLVTLGAAVIGAERLGVTPFEIIAAVAALIALPVAAYGAVKIAKWANGNVYEDGVV